MNGIESKIGSSFEEFLDEQGIREEVYSEAIKRVLAWQLEAARDRQSLTKSEMASRMGTSRAQLDRILDPENISISIESMSRAAQALGMRLKLELVEV